MPPHTASNPPPTPLTLHGAELLFPPLPYDLKPRADAALADPQLQSFLERATLGKDTIRRQSFREAFGPNLDAVRSLAGQVKQHTLDHLDHYLEMFIDRATAAGAQVHFALDAAQANAICVDIARRNNCKLCVKAKSMVTEETHLLPELAAIGVEAIETDLGEFILQLEGDAPSHIVTPMIHKNRAAVGRAFARELGVPYTEDAGELTMIARRYLRDKFRRADLGLSGGNFLVAETGSLVIVTNEGNGRLSTSVPPIHIAFVGIEKLIPRLSDLGLFLKMLARGSTGQNLTVYTHIITGPRRPPEHDGPQQLHIILVDNGRTKLLRSATRELLRCIRCGACLNACPVYRKIGGHSYGAVYSGPIGALITPELRGLANYPDLPQASSLCGACFEACPVKIDIPRQLIRLRAEMVTRKITGRRDRLAYRLWAWSLRYGWSYRFGGWMQKKFFRRRATRAGTMGGGDDYCAHGWVNALPGPLAGWTDQRDMPTPTPRSFRNWWNKEHRGGSKP
jgi:L-lactate dehydrogenase complex protein LldF